MGDRPLLKGSLRVSSPSGHDPLLRPAEAVRFPARVRRTIPKTGRRRHVQMCSDSTTARLIATREDAALRNLAGRREADRELARPKFPTQVPGGREMFRRHCLEISSCRPPISREECALNGLGHPAVAQKLRNTINLSAPKGGQLPRRHKASDPSIA